MGARVGICDPAGCFSPQGTFFHALTLSGQNHEGTLGVKSAVARFAGQSDDAFPFGLRVQGRLVLPEGRL